MFYKQFLKIIDIFDEYFINEFDFWLATLNERESKTISVSFLASKFDVKYSVADSLVRFAEREGILRKRYIVLCDNEECEFYYRDFDADELVKVLGERVYCHNCSKEFLISYKNTVVVYQKIKEPDVPETLIEEEIVKRINKNGGSGNFNLADSLAKNMNRIFDLYYSPDESAYNELIRLKKALDGPFNTTKEKGDALENLSLRLFKLIKNVTGTNEIRTFTNQIDCTIRFPDASAIFPAIMKYMSPYFVVECKNEKDKSGEGKAPSNTYFHKLSDIMSSNAAQIGIVVSRGEASREDIAIAHDNYLLCKNTNQQKILLSISDKDLDFLIEKRVNLIEYLDYKFDELTMNARNGTYEMFIENKII